MAAKFTSESQKKKKKIENVEDPQNPKFFRHYPSSDTEKMHCAFP